MTAPVVTSGGSNKVNEMKKMQFILPKEFDSMEKIPKPTNPKVQIVEIPSSTGAIHTFNGSCNDEIAKRKVEDLIDQLNKDGADINPQTALEKFSLFQYHPPFTIPIFRKNEVWIVITKSS